MRLYRAVCDCGFRTRQARWGYHHYHWWFPLYDIPSGQLSDQRYGVPESDQRRLQTLATQEEIAAYTGTFEARIKAALLASRQPEQVILIDATDVNRLPLCPGCQERSLTLRTTPVLAKCGQDCGHEYDWRDSEQKGCPKCGQRPHTFEFVSDMQDLRRKPVVCGCACSSSIACGEHRDCFCPKCGATPTQYEVEGIQICSLHEAEMIPYRLPENWLLIEPEVAKESARESYPHAKLWGEASSSELGEPSLYCPECEHLYRQG